MNYLIIEPDDITENILYCSQHKKYFSNNCSECILDANDPDTISKAKADTRLELAKAVREMIKKNPYDLTECSAISYKHDGYNDGLQAVLKLLEAKE